MNYCPRCDSEVCSCGNGADLEFQSLGSDQVEKPLEGGAADLNDTTTEQALRALEAAGMVERANGSKPGIQLLRAGSITITRPIWTWEGRVPSYAVSLLAGLEGLGKTVIAYDLAPRLTHGQLKGDRYRTPGHVVYVGVEDDWASIALPRLIAAGADLDRVHFVNVLSGAVFSVETDLPALATALTAIDDVALIIIDPLDAHLGEKVDSHRKSEVQRSMQPIAKLAQEHACAVLGIGHINKNELSRDVLMRVMGSKGFTTSARSVLAVGQHPEEERERVLVVRKSNFAERESVPALRYRLEKCEISHEDGGVIETARVVWCGEMLGIDADAILSVPNSEERTERDEAAAWLKDLLGNGEPLPYKQIERLAADTGIARATLHRARKLAGVEVERDEGARGRPSTWRLPVSYQSLALHSETKDITVLTRENTPDDPISSHISEMENMEIKPLGLKEIAETFNAVEVENVGDWEARGNS